MTPRKTRLTAALLALVAGLALVILLVARCGAPADRSSSTPAPQVGELPPDRTVDADPATSDAGPRTRLLEMGSPGGPGGAPSGPDPGEAGEQSGRPARPHELPGGSASVVFAVQDGSGRTLPDVSVTLESLEPQGGAERTVTDASGEARFLGLAPGAYVCVAEAPDRTERATASIRLNPGEQARLTLRLAGSGLSITGRVRNRQGEAIAGIGVSVVRHRFASAVSELASPRASRRSTRTDETGAFSVGDLEEGEYDVRTDATHRYPSTTALVQAGATSVDLIVAEALRVEGTVTNPDAEPLAGVWVGLDQRRDRYAHTDATGGYELRLDPADAASDPSVRFYLQGYEEQKLALPAPGARLDVELYPVEDAALVEGVVESERGEPIARAAIILGSKPLGTHYQTVSDADGRFSLPDTKIGPGYALRVLPDGPYLDFARQEIDVPEHGLSLEVVLESLSTGRLRGRMVDAEGNALPGFRLWVVSSVATRNALPISSDERGDFELADAPAGSLSFGTRASPRLAVQGVELAAGAERDVVLVLDWGEQEITGQVVDERGDPIAGAEVSLSWSYANGDVVSTSQRATRTNPNGSFRFGQLGPGEHRLDVRTPGYRAVQEYHDAGRYAPEVEIRLEPEGR
jgi:hypothetical protein